MFEKHALKHKKKILERWDVSERRVLGIADTTDKKCRVAQEKLEEELLLRIYLLTFLTSRISEKTKWR